jgi:hypothetical protein
VSKHTTAECINIYGLVSKSLAVVLIIVFIVSLTSWSTLRFVDENDHVEQRWRIEDYPDLKDKRAGATGSIDTNNQPDAH